VAKEFQCKDIMNSTSKCDFFQPPEKLQSYQLSKFTQLLIMNKLHGAFCFQWYTRGRHAKLL